MLAGHPRLCMHVIFHFARLKKAKTKQEVTIACDRNILVALDVLVLAWSLSKACDQSAKQTLPIGCASHGQK